jgi:hypothetical protein
VLFLHVLLNVVASPGLFEILDIDSSLPFARNVVSNQILSISLEKQTLC